MGPDGLLFDVHVTMLSITPVSTKYLSLFNSSVRKIKPAFVGKCMACAGTAAEPVKAWRRFSFPTRSKGSCTCGSLARNNCSCCRPAVWCRRRRFLSLCTWWGDPPPPQEGWRHSVLPPEYSCHLLFCSCYMRQVVLTTWKGALPPLFTPEVIVSRTSFRRRHRC